MTYEEALIIQDYIDDHPRDYALTPGMCEFIRPDGRCHVYEARPLLCRLYGLRGECQQLAAKIDLRQFREKILELYLRAGT